MRSPTAGVLCSEKTVEILRKLATQEVQLRGDDAESHSAAEVHYAFDRGSRRRRAREPSERPPGLSFSRGRQGMEHGEMGGELVAIGRIVSSPELIEPGEIARCDLGGDNQRAGHCSRAISSSVLNIGASMFVTILSPSTCADFHGKRRSVSPMPATPPCDTTT